MNILINFFLFFFFRIGSKRISPFSVWPCFAQSVEQPADYERAEVESIPAMAHRGAWAGIDSRWISRFSGISLRDEVRMRFTRISQLGGSEGQP